MPMVRQVLQIVHMRSSSFRALTISWYRLHSTEFVQANFAASPTSSGHVDAQTVQMAAMAETHSAQSSRIARQKALNSKRYITSHGLFAQSTDHIMRPGRHSTHFTAHYTFVTPVSLYTVLARHSTSHKSQTVLYCTSLIQSVLSLTLLSFFFLN